nr:unnamed protein product [Digitaria exilis]
MSRERGTNQARIPQPPCARRRRTADVRWSSSWIESHRPWRSLHLLAGAQLPRGPDGKRENLVLRADLEHGGLELVADPSRRHLLHRAGLLHCDLEEELEAVAGCPVARLAGRVV